MAEEGGVPKSFNISSAGYEGVERRRKLRIFEHFPATVRGVNVGRESFEVNTNLDNLSAGGLYLRMTQHVEQSTELFVIVRLAITTSLETIAPRVAIRGRVLRAEPQPGGICGVAVTFTRHRFL